MVIENFEQLRDKVQSAGKCKVVVIAAHDAHTLEAVLKTKDEGILDYVLVGKEKEILEIGKSLGHEIDPADVIDSPTDEDAVEKGIQDSVQKGPLAGYPVVGVKAVLYDGSYHPVDSSEMAFKTATIQAFKKGFLEADPILLEPIASVKVTVPDEYTGDIMGDLNKRRGRVLGMNPVSGGRQVIEADVPMTGMFGYCTTLRSMTGGRGTYEYAFARYEQAPHDVQEAEIAKRAAEE